METQESEKFRYESRCGCGKLLTKPMIRIEVIKATAGVMKIFNEHIRISFGAQTMCRRCKKLRETLNVCERKNLLVVDR